jgi:hypothetical protein
MAIKKCTCDHKFQDERYGKKNRVMNKTAKVNPTVYRCTVCKAERS